MTWRENYVWPRDEALFDAIASICDAPLPESIVEETGQGVYQEQERDRR